MIMDRGRRISTGVSLRMVAVLLLVALVGLPGCSVTREEDENEGMSLDNYNKGIQYMTTEQYSLAEQQFKLALQKNPEMVEAHYNLGITYLILKRWNEAIEPYKQAIRINPKDATAHFFLGAVYVELEDRESHWNSIKFFKTSIRIQLITCLS